MQHNKSSSQFKIKSIFIHHKANNQYYNQNELMWQAARAEIPIQLAAHANTNVYYHHLFAQYAEMNSKNKHNQIKPDQSNIQELIYIQRKFRNRGLQTCTIVESTSQQRVARHTYQSSDDSSGTSCELLSDDRIVNHSLIHTASSRHQSRAVLPDLYMYIQYTQRCRQASSDPYT